MQDTESQEHQSLQQYQLCIYIAHNELHTPWDRSITACERVSCILRLTYKSIYSRTYRHQITMQCSARLAFTAATMQVNMFINDSTGRQILYCSPAGVAVKWPTALYDVYASDSSWNFKLLSDVLELHLPHSKAHQQYNNNKNDD